MIVLYLLIKNILWTTIGIYGVALPEVLDNTKPTYLHVFLIRRREVYTWNICCSVLENLECSRTHQTNGVFANTLN